MSNWGGARDGAGRKPKEKGERKKGVKIYVTDMVREEIQEYGIGKSFSEKTVDLITSEIKKRKARES
ncbi:MAG: hypothetical protein ACOCRK_04470 [bacterium]